MAYREELKNRINEFIESQTGNICVSLFDLKEQDGFSIDGDRRVPSASMIKLVIMAELMRRVCAGELSLEEKIKITQEMRTGGDGVLKELEPGHEFSLREILTLMIIVSDNEATNILIQMLGMDRINRMAAELGLKEAVLGRKMMDSEAKKQGRDNFICADDIMLILKKIYERSCVDRKASALMLDILKRQQQSGRLQLYLPEDVEVAHKCGDLDFLENDGGIILLPGHPYILAVLTNGVKTNKDGREAIGRISQIIYEELSW